jgi:hypothetical protein
MVPFPDTVVVVGETDVMSPLFVAVITVLFALVMVTTEKDFGLPFFGNDRLEGADNTHAGCTGDAEGEEPGDGDGEVVGSVSGSVSGSGGGSSDGGVSGSSSDGGGSSSSSGSVSSVGGGSSVSEGSPPGDVDTSVDGFELSVISPIELSWKMSVPIVTSPEPDKLIVLGSRPSWFNSNPI